MGSGERRLGAGSITYQRIVEAGCDLLRRHGFRGVTLRAVAKAMHLSRGGLQFHVQSQAELAQSVLSSFTRDISLSLREAAGTTRGLARTWKLAEAWVKRSGSIEFVQQALQRDEGNVDADALRAIAVATLKGWVGATHRSLRQAQVQKELKADLDLRGLAVQIHQLLWSEGWTAALYGPAASRTCILASVHDVLSRAAVDTAASLPARSSLPAAAIPKPEPYDPMKDPFPPTWRIVLKPSEPLYHAFERHELMGDPRNFACKPEITPEDIEASRAHGGPDHTHSGPESAHHLG